MLLFYLRPVHGIVSFKDLGILACYKLLLCVHIYSIGRYCNILL